MRRLGWLPALLVAVLAAQATAQDRVVLQGRAIDPEGRPVAGAEIVLHRVGGGGGTRLATDTSDADGAFALIAAEAPDTASVYFAATRREGQLFVGPFVRPPFDDAPYELTVGGQPFTMDTPVPATAMPPAVRAPSNRRGALILLPVLGLIVAAAFALSRLGGRPERRLLLQLAVIDEEAGSAPLTPERQRERDRIVERLLSG